LYNLEHHIKRHIKLGKDLPPSVWTILSSTVHFDISNYCYETYRYDSSFI